MNKVKRLGVIVFSVVVFSLPVDSSALTRRSKPPRVAASVASVCPKIQTINPAQMFWKNNKPHRANSNITAPIIGYYKQMTLGNNTGFRSAVGTGSAVLYDSKGNALSSMQRYPCRSDHCGGRVVSSGATDVTRIRAMKATGSPVGYVKITKSLCIKIPDIGRCYGNEVDKGRPLCNQTVGLYNGK